MRVTGEVITVFATDSQLLVQDRMANIVDAGIPLIPIALSVPHVFYMNTSKLRIKKKPL